MEVTNLPEPYKAKHPAVHPALWRAAVSPTAAVATAAGVGIGVLDHSVVLAVVLGAAGWLARMAGAVVGRRRRERATRPRPADIDPWSVPEPWRGLLRQALSAQSRFDRAVEALAPGPTRDRLAELQPRLWEEVRALGEMARQGAAAGGWGGPATSPDRESGALSDELRRVQSERARMAGAGGDRDVELARREEALAAQVRAHRRAGAAAEAIQDRLRFALARLEQTVTDVATMEPTGGAMPALNELTDGITSLHDALAETAGTPPEPAGP